MSTLSRFGAALPLAAGVTFGIGVIMAALIAVEHSGVNDKSEVTSFEINPRVDEIVDVTRTQRIEKMELVEVPPPPPTLETQKADEPKHRITEIPGLKPIFKKPDVEITPMAVAKVDTERAPLLRVLPIMPPRAERSGHCTVRFSVDTAGRPFDIDATYCTDRVFERATIKSVEKWKYNPTVRNGVTITETGITNRVTFRLTDDRGAIIPE